MVSGECPEEEADEAEPLVDTVEPIPVSEMHAISFLGALHIPVSQQVY